MATQFEEAYRRAYRKFAAVEDAKDALVKLREKYALAADAYSHVLRDSTLYPITIGSGRSRATILSIGQLPIVRSEGTTRFPLNFNSRKRFSKHSEYKRNSKERIVYCCSVTHNGPRIVAEDGKVWEDPGCWERFAADANVDGAFSSFADFSGLDHMRIQMMIEELIAQNEAR
ncbi:hypothetical protein PAPHI01_0394 [Pancytospora philotis]|nr:hypothetical protein PAPHI01_0394 [Pancytospora philotis]